MADEKETKYYDQRGMEIGDGDLLKIFHFTHYRRKKKVYMYHVAVLVNHADGFFWGGRAYDAEKTHYWLKSIADKDRVLINCLIIHKRDYENELRHENEARQRRKELNLELRKYQFIKP